MESQSCLIRGIIIEKEYNKVSNLPCSTFVSLNFEENKNPKSIIGEAFCYLEDNVVKADILFYDKEKFKKLKKSTPAISCLLMKDEKIIKLTSLSLCSTKNKDESIENLEEQLYDNHKE